MNEDDAIDKIQAILNDLGEQLPVQHTELMDFHHESIKQLRKVIVKLETFRERYNDQIDEIILRHTIAARSIAEIYGDLILAEQGLEASDEEDEEDE